MKKLLGNWKKGNLRREGNLFYSYSTVIGIYDEENNLLTITSEKFSHTTSCHQTYLKNNFRWKEVSAEEFAKLF